MRGTKRTIRAGLVLLFGCTLLFAIGCGGKKTLWGNPKTGYVLTYRLEPSQIWSYITSSKQGSEMEMMGQPMITQSAIDVHYTLEGKEIDPEKNLLTTVTLDSLGFYIKSVQGEKNMDLSSLIGKQFGLTLTPLGDEVEFTGIDSLPQVDFGRMAGGVRTAKSFFQDPFPDLPKTPVKIGDTWTDTKNLTQNQNGMDINVNKEFENKVVASELIDGVECLKIQSKIKGTLDGKGKQMGMDMAFEGDMEADSEWFFAYKKGALMSLSTDQIMEATIAVSGQANMTIPLIQESNTTIKLVY